MNNILHTIYNSLDIIVAIIIGIWFISTKGDLGKSFQIIPAKWCYIGGYIAIIYAIAQTITLFR